MHLWRKLGLHVLHLTPQHEGLQDLVQAVDDNNPFLSFQPFIFLLGPLCTFAQRVPKPFCEGALIIEDLQQGMSENPRKYQQKVWLTVSNILGSHGKTPYQSPKGSSRKRC